MKVGCRLVGALGVALVSLVARAGADPRSVWSHVGQVEAPESVRRGVLGAIGVGALETPRAYAAFTMDDRRLESMLRSAPMEFTEAAERAPVVMLPRPDGTLEAFTLVESPILHPLVAAKYPTIRTYAAQGVDNPAVVARVSMNELGFFATVLSPEGDYAVAPLEPVTAWRNPEAVYASAYSSEINGPWECGFEHEDGPRLPDMSAFVSTGPTLRTYQLACAMEGTMCVNLAGGTVAGGLSAVTTAVNAVNVLWEKEFAIRFILFADSDKIIFTNPATDPYNNSSNSSMLEVNGAAIDENSDAPYDVGHVLAWAGGGVARRGSACSGDKAAGVSGNMFSASSFANPQTFMHELGHQFNAPHSWNSPNGACTSGQWGGTGAFEPGSGSTIMSYAGSCSPDNLQGGRDNYYSLGGQQSITDFAAALPCTVAIPTTNSAPVVSSPILNNDVVPIGTPFELTGSAIDPDGDAITYIWEQRDTGPQRALSAGDGGSGPLFRSFPASATGNVRMFPRRPTVLSGNLAGSIGEILPSTTRTIRFRLIARDNRAGGGGVNFVDRQIRSISTVGPFKITAPNVSGAHSGAVVVRWDVKGTDVTTFNHKRVNIWLSTNGGNSFTTLLKGATPNDGVEPVVLPQTATTQARIMVRPLTSQGNEVLYFDISDANLTLSAAPSAARVATGGVPIIGDSVGNGNANAAPEPGESNVQIWFDLLSTGLLTATDVTATLQSLTTGVTVTQPNISFADMPQGALERNAIPALISIAPSVACGSNASLRLNVSTAQGPFTINYTVKLGPTNNICASPAAYCPGDLNDDGLVDDTDFVIFAVAYDALNAGGGDLNFDTLTDDLDFVLFAEAYDMLVCP